MDKNKTEYRLEYLEDFNIEVQYFDELNDAYTYITNHKLTTFMIVKEELIANRMDTYRASSEN